MAERVVRWNRTAPTVTEFEFGGVALLNSDINILRFDDYNCEWLNLYEKR